MNAYSNLERQYNNESQMKKNIEIKKLLQSRSYCECI
jgi:hypothetical protein